MCRHLLFAALALELLAASLALAGNGFSIADASIAEGNSNNPTLSFAVTLQACTAPPPGCSVSVATQNGVPAEALAGVDYTPISHALIFSIGPAGPPETLMFMVTIISDDLVELDETFNVILLNPIGAAIDNNVGTGTIVNDDSATVSTGSLVQIFEGGSVDITFLVTPRVDVAVQVQTEILAGTATAGVDYTVVSVEATIPAGEMFGGGVIVNTTEDQLVELDESLQAHIVSIEAGGRAVSIHPTFDSTPILIRNDDSAVLDLAGVSELEGDIGVTIFAFAASLSQAVDAPVEVFYTTTDGTATASSGDYGAEASSVILSGTTQGEVPINVNGDQDPEPDEVFTLDMLSFDANGRDVSSGQVTATGTIRNDDDSGLIFSDGFESGSTDAWSP